MKRTHRLNAEINCEICYFLGGREYGEILNLGLVALTKQKFDILSWSFMKGCQRKILSNS